MKALCALYVSVFYALELCGIFEGLISKYNDHPSAIPRAQNELCEGGEIEGYNLWLSDLHYLEGMTAIAFANILDFQFPVVCAICSVKFLPVDFTGIMSFISGLKMWRIVHEIYYR